MHKLILSFDAKYPLLEGMSPNVFNSTPDSPAFLKSGSDRLLGFNPK